VDSDEESDAGEEWGVGINSLAYRDESLLTRDQWSGLLLPSSLLSTAPLDVDL
jgi:hypothetical protein